MTDHTDNLQQALEGAVRRFLPGADVRNLKRLTGGANQQMWSLDAVTPDQSTGLILRQASDWNQGADETLALNNEARLLIRAAEHGLPVPAVHYVLTPEDGLGVGYLMARVEGETLPQRILREERYASARARLARQCGEALARVHQLPVDDLAFLPRATAEEAVRTLYAEYQGYQEPRPVFELAFRWLRDNQPALPATRTLVHGDFRNGNLMVDDDGLKAILDWEMASVGDPMADLGWMCVNSWRFGQIDLPVGGFGRREELFAGYREVAGVAPDPQRVRYWEIFGTLKWGVICQKMAASFVAGQDTSVERGAIGRRASEAEVDLLRELVPLAVANPEPKP